MVHVPSVEDIFKVLPGRSSMFDRQTRQRCEGRGRAGTTQRGMRERASEGGLGRERPSVPSFCRSLSPPSNANSSPFVQLSSPSAHDADRREARDRGKSPPPSSVCVVLYCRRLTFRALEKSLRRRTFLLQSFSLLLSVPSP